MRNGNARWRKIPPALSQEVHEWLSEQSFERHRIVGELASAVRKARKDAGLSQSALAAKIGSTQASLSRLERGRLTDIGAQMLQRIGSAMGLETCIEFRQRSSE